MSLWLRIHPLGYTAGDVRNQWARAPAAGAASRRRLSLIRTVPEDPSAGPFVGLLDLASTELAALEIAWAEAQLAADATMLGLALGLRVGLVPEGRCWSAELLIIRTGGRLRLGRRNSSAVVALLAARRSLIRTLEPPATPAITGADPRSAGA